MSPFAQTASVLDMTVVASIRALASPGEPDIFMEVCELFLADVPAQLAVLRAAVEANDTESVWRIAHQVRGSAAGIGACRMAATCAEMEEAARAGAAAGGRQHLEKLDREFTLVSTQLRQLPRVTR